MAKGFIYLVAVMDWHFRRFTSDDFTSVLKANHIAISHQYGR